MGQALKRALPKRLSHLFAGPDRDAMVLDPRADGCAKDRSEAAEEFADFRRKNEPYGENPKVVALREHALEDLFQYYGLTVIPRLVWTIHTDVKSPVATLIKTAEELGGSIERIRSCDSLEQARLQAALELLVALDSVRANFTDEGIAALTEFIRGADAGRLSEFERVIDAFVGMLTGRGQFAVDERFLTYRNFIADIERYLADPVSLSPEDADDALRFSDQLTAHMERFRTQKQEFEELSERIRNASRLVEVSEADEEYFLGVLSYFSEEQDALFNQPLTPEEIADQLRALEVILDDLRAFHDRLIGRADDAEDGTGGHDGAAELSRIDQALQFFGFACGSRPDKTKIRQAWTKRAMANHPDRAGAEATPAERAQLDANMKEINGHWDVLRKAFG